jgi:hypothetical protein
MSAGTAMGMVSESLREMLVGEMTLIPPVNVTILNPSDPGGDRRVNLFLYKVVENPFLKNLDWQVRPGNPNRLVPPPLSLTLSYVLTGYAPNDPLTGNTTSQGILGEAMRVFYEHQVIPHSYLVTGLDTALEEVRIVHSPIDVDEMSRIWSTFTQPYRTSALYEVSVVQIDVLPASEQVMPKRVRHVGVPQVRAPFRPPIVTTMTPASGPAGTVVTFGGQDLGGWHADVQVTGHAVLKGADLTADSFTATMPATLDPGFHEVRVDISRLFRRVFFFEVT